MENRSSQRSSQRRVLALVIALAALLLALSALACPAKAMAGDEYVAYVTDMTTLGKEPVYYDNIDEAIAAANGENKTLTMLTDWFIRNDIQLVGKFTIDMNGHQINNVKPDTAGLGNGGVFWVWSDSSLTLTSSCSNTFSYKGYQTKDGNKADMTLTSGGLITGGIGHSGIGMGDNAHLVLENVAIAGNCGDDGAIYTGKNSTIELRRGASIQNNLANSDTGDSGGGGIRVGGENVSITLDNSKIIDNCSAYRGGGIYSYADRTYIDLKNGSEIRGNVAQTGGGVYFDYSYFTLESSDGTGSVSGNKAMFAISGWTERDHKGGGIYIDNKRLATHEGTIKGLKIKDNYSSEDGGGIYLDQRWTKIANCTIAGNTSGKDGGAIYVNGSNNSIENCTITGNSCNLSNKNYEGGGVFVSYKYDIKMTGLCVVKNNTRGKDSGNADDVFLSTLSGGGGKAYITGSLSKGSSVGVRTGITDDRRIAKSFKPETKDCLFYDMGGYYVSYGSDEGGDAWQRHTTKEFTVKLSSEVFGKYRNGTSVALVAPLTKGDDRLFWYWDSKYTTGLNPISDYITDKNMNSNTLAFKMPQNDVDANAIYATRATKVAVGIKAPVAGEDLTASAELYRANGIGSTRPFPATVTWYEVTDTGKIAAAGKAKAGTTYIASITCAQSQQGGLCFSKSFSADGVIVKDAATGGDGPKAVSASVDEATGTLTVVTAAFDKTSDDVPATKTGKVTVKKVEGELKDAVNAAQASLASSIAFCASGDVASQASGESLGEVEVSYDYTESDSGKVTIVAPAHEGYNFCNWENVPEGIEIDNETDALIVPASMLGTELEVTAVYTPVVTKMELSFDAPTAAGSVLAGEAEEVSLTCSNGERVALGDIVGTEILPVIWLPEEEGGKAGYSTSYIAMIKVYENATDLVDTDKVVSTDAVIVAANGVQAESAGFVLLGDSLYLCVAFPDTPDVKATSVSHLDGVELTFEEAKDCAVQNDWLLPKTVDVELENGEIAEGDISWNAVEGFDADATTTQELTVTGAISHIAYDDEVNTDDISLDVSTTIKIAAPAQGDNGNSVDASDKSPLAKTGDSTLVLVFAFIGVAAIAVISLSVLRRRRIRL